MLYLPVLTSLRFFAALSILFFHLQGPFGIGDPYEPFGLGVSFFFVLSGFILTHVYGRLESFNYRAFVLHRFARLWPIHLLTLAATIVILQPYTFDVPGWHTDFLANLFLVQAWLPINGYVFSFNAVSWSISAEAAFYLAFPFFLLTKRPAVVWCLLCIAVILLVGAPNYSGMLLVPDRPWVFSPVHFMQQHPAVRVLEFCVGVMAGRYYLTGARAKWTPARATMMQLIGVFAVLLFAITALPVKAWLSDVAGIRQIGVWYNQSGGFAAFAVLIYAFAHDDGLLSRYLTSRVMVRLGEMSFSLYMVHQIIIRWSVGSDWIGRFGYVPALGLTVLMSFGSAYVAWKFVEIPSRRAILSLSRKPRTQAASASSGRR